MEIIHIEVTDEHKNNLRILSDFLKNHVPPPKFNMRKYIETDVKVSSYKTYINQNGKFVYQNASAILNKDISSDCGTIACAAGHGPLAGIKPLDDHEDWIRYCERVFGTSGASNIRMFQWMFGMEWCYIDNTPTGAAARIDFFLENGGIPNNYFRQMEGKDSLTYKVMDKENAG